MNKRNLISSASFARLIPVRDYTRALIQSQCPFCKKQMPSFHRYRLDKRRILACTCGYKRCVNEDEYEAITELCFICGKSGCCASDHRFNGVIPAGMGL
jgi:hypothetical protein